MVVRCKTSYTGLFSFLAIPLLMGDIMIEFMNMIDINGQLFLPKHDSQCNDPSFSEHHDHNGGDDNGNNSSSEQQQ